LGLALVEAGRLVDAILAFQQVLKLNPGHLEVALRSGLLLLKLERYEEAIKHFDLCEELQPNQAPVPQARAAALQNFAVSLHKQKRFEEALALSRQAYELTPAGHMQRRRCFPSISLPR